MWSFGEDTQVILSKYIKVREKMQPYIDDLQKNISRYGGPTVRPLWYEYPEDADAFGLNDEYLLGPELLVAPVYKRGAWGRDVYFPGNSSTIWESIWNSSDVHPGGTRTFVSAPLDMIPVFKPRGSYVAGFSVEEG